MKVEQARSIVNNAIEELSQALERGHSETLRKYLEAVAMFLIGTAFLTSS